MSDWLCKTDNVVLCSCALNIEMLRALQPYIIVSYNYDHIIREDVIDFMKGNIINLHISLLPWNRGDAPNIWSFLEDTPKGITIHKIDKGLDTGAIIVQKVMLFDERIETFSTTYKKLNEAIVEIFKENWSNIKNKNYVAFMPNGKGTYHTKKDLINLVGKDVSYDMKIIDFKKLYKME